MNDESDLRALSETDADEPRFRFLKRYWPGLAALALVVFVVALVPISPGGCSVDPRQNVAQTHVTEDLAQPVDDLTLAQGALESIPTSPPAQDASDPGPLGRTLYYLNKWMRQQDAVEIDEKLDPLVDQVPISYRGRDWPEQFQTRLVSVSDIYYLLECTWMRSAASRIASAPISDERRARLLTQEQKLGIDNAARLDLAERLFDWTISNIQLDPLPPPPAPPRATAQTDDPAARLASQPGPLRGEVGPGYTHVPWQTLLIGHGDAWERSRVFILLARQAGLDVVMLALPDTQGTGGSKPWLAALLLGDQLYLFDAALGLPVPGPAGSPIATLEQVVADPGLLSALDIEGVADYPVGESELSTITALIDAQMPSMSVRMRLLEPAFSGQGQKDKLVITTRPSELQRAVRKCKHIATASLWRVPIEAELYQAVLPLVLRNDPVRSERLLRENFPFELGQPLLHARHLHLQGQFSAPKDEESNLGALERYLQLRHSDKEIESMGDIEGRRAVGLDKLPLPDDQQQQTQVIERLMSATRLVKHHATYWIALAHYDAGNHEIAIEWFRDRVIAGAPDSPWQQGARYNLARSYEALGRFEEAQRTLASDDASPQRHGNLLRALSLGQRDAAPTSDEPATKGAEDSAP